MDVSKIILLEVLLIGITIVMPVNGMHQDSSHKEQSINERSLSFYKGQTRKKIPSANIGSELENRSLERRRLQEQEKAQKDFDDYLRGLCSKERARL